MKIHKLAKNTIIFLGAATLAFSPAINSTALGTFMGAIQAQAAQQSYTWVQEGEIWRLKDASGNNVANTWYQDVTGARYYLDASGVMKTGLVDVSGYSYYLDASGKMMVTDGVYEGVNLIFDKDVNSATYGAITSGAQELKAAKQTQAQPQVAQQQNNNAAPVHGQTRTCKNGDIEQYDANFGCWIVIQSSGGQVTGIDMSPEMIELSRQVGENMAH